MPENRDLTGSVVAVTGATAGIGREVARQLVAAGARVALGGRRTERLDELVAEQERLIELLKEKRQAVISHAVTKGLDPIAAEIVRRHGLPRSAVMVNVSLSNRLPVPLSVTVIVTAGVVPPCASLGVQLKAPVLASIVMPRASEAASSE